MMNKENNILNDIASKHLGKSSDGSIISPYITPEFIDKSLLVAVPRYLNRVNYNIIENNLPFLGYDSWNCYEFSTLTNNGFPVCGILHIVYEANSTNIVESKSLKLYLNSFNMVKMGDTIEEVITNVVSIIQKDLTTVITSEVDVSFHNNYDNFNPDTCHDYFETILPNKDTKFEIFNESPELLEFTDEISRIFYHTNILRSNCRVTNQPDWGDIFLYYSGNKYISPDSFLKYIVSMRKENHFHEEICELIYKRLFDIIQPKELLVACYYTRRGGIDINPIRASNNNLIYKMFPNLSNSKVLSDKTLRQ